MAAQEPQYEKEAELKLVYVTRTQPSSVPLISFGWCWSGANSNDSKHIQDGPRYLLWWPGRIILRSGASLASLFTFSAQQCSELIEGISELQILWDTFIYFSLPPVLTHQRYIY